ncbi:MAG: pyridoxal phosphate-dependent aminotransferase [Acidimicrobiales bacterium]
MQETLPRSINAALDSVALSAFEDVGGLVAALGGPDLIALDQGKTWFPPCVEPCAWTGEEFDLAAHEHAPPAGAPRLRNAIASHLEDRGLRQAGADQILVTAGATHGVGLAIRAVVSPGDEVLVLSPQWLFAAGLVEAAGGHTVEVPVFLELGREADFDLTTALAAAFTSRSRAIYFNTPNNPSGYSLRPGQLAEVATFAAEHDLWIIADNAYEIYDFTAAGFVDIASLPLAAERTFSVYTFSKTYAMPGYRVGYVVAPEEMVVRMQKWGLYSVYAVSTTSQFAALKALATPDAALDERRDRARQARDMVMQELVVPHTPTSGGLYTFLDVGDWPGGAGTFVAEAVRAGVSLAPGTAFGRHCARWARLCFTAVDVDRLSLALGRLNALWDGPAR